MTKEYLIVNVVFDVSRNGAFANTGKEYAFVAYEDMTAGDVVVVDTVNGFQLATVTGFRSRIPEKAERIKQLKAEMNKRVDKLKEEAVFEMMAEKDPTLKAMFDEFKALQG